MHNFSFNSNSNTALPPSIPPPITAKQLKFFISYLGFCNNLFTCDRRKENGQQNNEGAGLIGKSPGGIICAIASLEPLVIHDISEIVIS